MPLNALLPLSHILSILKPLLHPRGDYPQVVVNLAWLSTKDQGYNAGRKRLAESEWLDLTRKPTSHGPCRYSRTLQGYEPSTRRAQYAFSSL
jgi:hypothetical protein